ncbi:ATP synthase F0 subunit A [bacterium]|nr:MAG: ATP synthase F0 subunit A [bacterium]RKZ12737.1 MAG: ATP synthase F0 subunit A [bacterium]
MRRSLIVLAALLWLLPAADLALASDPPAEEHATTEAVDAAHGEAAASEADTHGEAAGDHDPVIHGDEHAADAEHGEADAHHGEHLELPHIIMILRNLGPLAGNESFASFTKIFENFIFAAMAGLFLVFLSQKVYRNRQMLPGRLQSAFELVVEQLLSITVTMMGEKDGKKYAPLIMTIFAYILCMNYSGLLLFGKAPTSTLINNASIALTVFVFVQFTGVQRNGVLGYLHHLAGSPKDVVGWCLSPLMFMLEVVGELIKPLSLSLRLFGNIFGEDTLLAVFALLGVVVVSFIPGLGDQWWMPGVPFHLPFLFLSMLLGLIQALVFALLTSVYITLMLPHGDHDEEHAAAH